MPSDKTALPLPAKWPVFSMACWILGLVAFCQLLVAGLALSERFERSQVVKIVEKEVPKLVTVRAAAPREEASVGSIVSRPPVSYFSAPPAAAPTPVAVPGIADPRSERLIREARQARVAGNMDRAILKLEEARGQSPEDPNVRYELGRVHEEMGVFDIAASHYEAVFQMGVSGAGSLYEMAAAKLRDGFEQPGAMLGKLALGRVRIFNDPENEDGQRVILTIPVQKAPGVEIGEADFQLTVIFFNRTTRGEIVQLEDSSWVAQKWMSLPIDWAGGEESVQMTYTIPPQDGTTEHLFGERAYYGQVVSLQYKGEVVDVQAWPRDLAARIPQQPADGNPLEMEGPRLFDPGALPPDFDPMNPLLPALPVK